MQVQLFHGLGAPPRPSVVPGGSFLTTGLTEVALATAATPRENTNSTELSSMYFTCLVMTTPPSSTSDSRDSLIFKGLLCAFMEEFRCRNVSH